MILIINSYFKLFNINNVFFIIIWFIFIQYFFIIFDKIVKFKLRVYSIYMYFYLVVSYFIKILFLIQFNNKISFICDFFFIFYCEFIRSDYGFGERFIVRDYSEVIGSRVRGEIQVVECDGRVGVDFCVGYYIVAGFVEFFVCFQSYFIVSYLLIFVL